VEVEFIHPTLNSAEVSLIGKALPSENPAFEEIQLLRQVQSGDEEAFLFIYRRHEKALYRFALQFSGSATIAEDVVQEVFLTLLTRPEQYDSSRGCLANYLLGVAHKLVLRQWEKQKRHIPLENSDLEDSATFNLSTTAGDVWEKFAQEDATERLHQAIASLPVHYREVVVLCDLEERNYAETADILNCPVGTIRSRLSRAHLLLMGKMQPENFKVSSGVGKSSNG
jgi:RNA polymerase sigma-70 factor, ECF subfamily